jgi:hypothetical protein
MSDHFDYKRRRKADFYNPPNVLKAKVGSGGLDNSILEKAQKLLENHTEDFEPLAEMYLSSLLEAYEEAKNFKIGEDAEGYIGKMIAPAVQLKANGGMFHYPLITSIADVLVNFLEIIEIPDAEVLNIVKGFHNSMHIVIKGRIHSKAGDDGDALIKELEGACERYFRRYPERVTLVEYE